MSYTVASTAKKAIAAVRLAAVSMLLWFTTAAQAATADVHLTASHKDGSAQPADTSISTSSDFLRVEWDSAQGINKYRVTQMASSDTIMSDVTQLTYHIIDMRKAGSELTTVTIEPLGAKGPKTSSVMRLNVAKVTGTGLILNIAIHIVALCLMAFGLWYYLRRQRKRLEDTQHELENAQVRHTRKFDFVTVLFTDIEGFTKIAEHTDPEQLVDELDRLYIYFDDLVNKYGIEKIKTIGDAYMCAGGVPDTDSANPIEVALVGLEMMAYVQERRASKDGFWNIRIGINTGPVISAQLGHIKKVFDIWGDSVNTASRMESSSAPGRVNVSDSTYQKIQDFFECEHRGKMPVKYKGEIDMYFVNRLKPEYCLPGTTCKPNALLMRKLQLLKVSDLEQKVADSVLRGMHDNVGKRMDTMLARVRTLACMEEISDDDMIISSISAILCFVQEEFPKGHAILSKSSVDDLMRRLHLSDQQKDRVNKVMVHVGQQKQPEDIVEEIIYDALNEVYGRKDIVPLLFAHYDDLAARGVSLTRNEWLNTKRNELTSLIYYTDAAKKLCQVPKKKQLEIIDMAMTA